MSTFEDLIANGIYALEQIVKHPDFLEVLLEQDFDFGISECHECLESFLKAYQKTQSKVEKT